MGKPKPKAPQKATPITLGITVSCGADNKMNNDFSITISPQLPDQSPKEETLKFTGDPPTGAKDIAKAITEAIAAKGGKAKTKSHTVSTSSPRSISKKDTTTDVCVVEVTNLASMDIGTDDDKVRLYDVAGGGAGLAAPGGGLTKRKGSSSPIKLIDCKKYKEEIEKDRRRRKRLRKKPRAKGWGPSMGSETDWFCNPENVWASTAPRRGIMAIASVVVGIGEIPLPELPLPAPSVGPEWVVIPFLVIPHSLALQNLEIKTRLASAGVVTSDRDDGVIEPLRFIAGHLEGEDVRVFGFITPYDPLGYGAFPWTVIVGEADAVASHLIDTSTPTRDRVVVPASATVRTDHRPVAPPLDLRSLDPSIRPTIGDSPLLGETPALLQPVTPEPEELRHDPSPGLAQGSEVIRPHEHLD